MPDEVVQAAKEFNTARGAELPIATLQTESSGTQEKEIALKLKITSYELMIEHSLPKELTPYERETFMRGQMEHDIKSSFAGMVYSRAIGLESSTDLELSKDKAKAMLAAFEEEGLSSTLPPTQLEALKCRCNLLLLREDRIREIERKDAFYRGRFNIIKTMVAQDEVLAGTVFNNTCLEAVFVGTKPGFTLDTPQEVADFKRIHPQIRENHLGLELMEELVYDPVLVGEVIQDNPEAFTPFGHRPEDTLTRDKIIDLVTAIRQRHLQELSAGDLSQETDDAFGAILGIPEQARKDYYKYKSLKARYEDARGSKFPSVYELHEYAQPGTSDGVEYTQFLETMYSTPLGQQGKVRAQNHELLERLYNRGLNPLDGDTHELIDLEISKNPVLHYGVFYMVYGDETYRNSTSRRRGQIINNAIYKYKNRLAG